MVTSILPTTLAFISLPGGTEWVVILVIGLLLFGSRLPQVGRSIGQGIKEFKKGLKDVEDDVKHDEPARKSLPHEQTMSSPEGTRESSKSH
ncbi:MAG: Sec-independent protein translocase subunit TatA/TatB [Phycisphaerales bacterium]